MGDKPIGERMAAVETLMVEYGNDMKEVKSKVDGLISAFNGRPSWAVVLIMTMLSSAVVGLTVRSVTNAKPTTRGGIIPTANATEPSRQAPLRMGGQVEVGRP